jgi:hypothetical protein
VKVAFAIALAAGIAAAAPGTRDRIPPGLDDFANSAALPYGLLTVNVDITENDGPTLPGEASVFVSLNAQATWTETLLTEMPGEPGGTWESASSIADGDVFYYFIVRDDSSAAMSAPLNALDAFPPPANLLADPRDEPAGDANAPNSQAVDLTGAAFGYSDTHFYATLSNATGTWPFSGGLFGPWYVYSALVDNPDAGEDSLALALVYANVPLIASSGLYAVDARDSTYARVGDIDCAVQGGKLHMRAALEDLYAQPAFGASNPSGKFHVGAGTATSLITTYRFENDRTHPYALYHRTDVARVGANEPPSLSDGGWEPAAQTGRDTPVRFFVTYTDPDGNLPVTRSVVVDGVPREMISATPVHDYAAGVTFECETSLPPRGARLPLRLQRRDCGGRDGPRGRSRAERGPGERRGRGAASWLAPGRGGRRRDELLARRGGTGYHPHPRRGRAAGENARGARGSRAVGRARRIGQPGRVGRLLRESVLRRRRRPRAHCHREVMPWTRRLSSTATPTS